MTMWTMFWTLCAVLLAGCATPGDIAIEARGHLVPTDDGVQIATFDIRDRDHPDRPPRALLFYVQGSENESAQRMLPQLAGAAVMGVRPILTERRGIGFDGTVDEAVARTASTLEQRVADHRAVIDWYTQRAGPELPVILIGGSEGGTVAGALAASDPRITHLVLIGSGGWTQARELRYLLEEEGRGFGVRTIAELDARLAEVRESPDAMTMWAGHPYRRWSSFLWHDPLEDLRALSIPVLVAHGAQDKAVPVESARAIRDAFADDEPPDGAARPDVTYAEFPDLDHSLFDNARNVSGFPHLEIELANFFCEHGLIGRAERDALIARVTRAHPELFETDP